MSGRIEALWTKRARRGVMDPAERVQAVEGEGIEGDVNLGRGSRQVTVIEQEVFDRLRDELPNALPAMRRANVMVSGVRLEESRGRLLALGDVRIRIVGETVPCGRMEEQCAGLQEALRPGWGGGAYGRVEQGGELEVGAEAGWVER